MKMEMSVHYKSYLEKTYSVKARVLEKILKSNKINLTEEQRGKLNPLEIDDIIVGFYKDGKISLPQYDKYFTKAHDSQLTFREKRAFFVFDMRLLLDDLLEGVTSIFSDE